MRGSEPGEGPVPGQAGLIQIPQEPRDMDTQVKHDAAVTSRLPSASAVCTVFIGPNVFRSKQRLSSPRRRWVLQQILRQCSAVDRGRAQQQGGAEQSQQLSDHLARTLHMEMKVCCDAACRYPSNYNAWSHRIWVLQHMARGNVKVGRGERLMLHVHVSRNMPFCVFSAFFRLNFEFSKAD